MVLTEWIGQLFGAAETCGIAISVMYDKGNAVVRLPEFPEWEGALFSRWATERDPMAQLGHWQACARLRRSGMYAEGGSL